MSSGGRLGQWERAYERWKMKEKEAPKGKNKAEGEGCKFWQHTPGRYD